MKKTYSKPDIFYEDFSLSTNIAANCELHPTEFIGDTFIVDLGGVILLTNMEYCNYHIEDGKNEFDNLCYHVPTDSYNIFSS